jgi:predicted DNA binding CopG/RHH family protein
MAELRKKAAKRGLGYQTMLKMIVREHLDEYWDACASAS